MQSQKENLHWFWKIIYGICILTMPWSILFIIIGFWYLDDRIDDVEEKITNKKDAIYYE